MYKSLNLKDNYLNYILDKISSGTDLSKKEKSFLDNIGNIDETDIKDYTHLTSRESFSKINSLINKGKRITYDLNKIKNKFVRKIIR